MIRVFLDTNFIVSCLRKKIPFLDEIDRVCNFGYVLFIVPQVLEELEELSKDKDEKRADRETAKLGLKILEKAIDEGKVGLLDAKGENVDDALFGVCEEDDILATLDKELKKRLGCRLITLRQGSHLELL